MSREYGRKPGGEQPPITFEAYNPVTARTDEFSPERMEKMGIHPHFEEMEIETKLDIGESGLRTVDILQKIKSVLEGKGYAFVGDLESRENFIIYYPPAHEGEHKGKIIARNRGTSGFQVKHKSGRLRSKFPFIIIKPEVRSPIFKNLEAAEQHMASEHGYDASHRAESIARRKVYKYTMAAIGEDAVARYFRLVADETEDPHEREASSRLKQIELEYKGSNSEKDDNLDTIQRQMETIILAIQAIKALPLQRTLETKRGWVQKKQKASL